MNVGLNAALNRLQRTALRAAAEPGRQVSKTYGIDFGELHVK